MKIEEQVLSIEQMKRLKGLGLKVEDTALSWADLSEPGKFSVSPNYENAHEILREGCVITPTLTLQEILELLPKKIENTRHEIFWLNFYYDSISYQDYDGCLIIRFDLFPSPLKSLYNILCWVLENGYLKS